MVPFTHHFASLLCHSKHTFIKEKDIFFFGWDGSLLPSRREHAAYILYSELKKQIELAHATKNPFSKIHLLTHSHGGNVALLLLHILEIEDIPFIIDQLIMMGCPIQKITEAYAFSPAIKKIVSIYSKNDGVQKNDLQIMYSEAFKDGNTPPIRSKRTFKNHAPHIWQIRLSINSKSYGHQLFTTELVLPHIPLITHTTEQLTAGKYALNIITNNKQPIELINIIAE